MASRVEAWMERLDALEERAAWAVGVGLGGVAIGVGAAADGLGLGGLGVIGAGVGVGVVGWRWAGGELGVVTPPELPPKPSPEPWAGWWGDVPAPVRPGGVPGPEVLRAAAAPVMVWVGGGEYWMGSRDDDPRGYDDEKPRHKVSLSPLAVGATVVTRRQWKEVMGEGRMTEGAPDEPVTHVDWWDAVAYCNTLSKRQGLEACYELSGEGDLRTVVWRRGANGYRLPTEAEWEFLARAGTETAWSFGDDEARVGEHAWFGGNAEARVHPVAGKEPNPWGLYDLHGNVWEWCADRHRYAEGAVVDPVEGRPWGPDDVDTGVDNTSGLGRGVDKRSGRVRLDVSQPRALRGGAFWNGPGLLRSALRFRGVPASRTEGIGFRCVRGAARQLDR
jgi:formylglycine-generating enzyme required for sulfatase activity